MSRRKPTATERIDLGDVTLYRRTATAVWWLDYHIGGRRVRRTTGEGDRGRAAAAALAAYEEARAAAGRVGRGEGVDLAQLGGLDVERAVAENGAGPRQRESLLNCWKHLTRLLGHDTDPATLTYDVVLSYVGKRRAEGARGQSIRKETQALKRMVDDRCVREGWRAAALGRWPKIKSDPAHEGQAGKLHPPEVVARWLELLRSSSRERTRDAGLQATLVVLTGLRATEARRVTWRWVEPAPAGSDAAAVLRCPAWATKGRRERVVGLPAEALAVLTLARAGKADGEPLFPHDGKQARESACRKLGLDGHITLRDLRHCHATWGGQGTGDPAGLQGALGHRDLRTTQRYLSATTVRAAAVAVAVAEELHRHSGPSQSEEPVGKAEVERVEAIGFEPTTSCVQSIAEPLLEHLSRCSTCLSAVEAVVSVCLGDGGRRHSDRHTTEAA